MAKQSTISDKETSQYLSRAALTGGMGGIGIGGLISLAYMLAEALKDKPRASAKRREVLELSPHLPTTAITPITKKTSTDKSDDEDKADLDWWDSTLGTITDAGRGAIRGAWAVPVAAGALALPAWLSFKFLKNRYESSRRDQLRRELESAREEFRQALKGGTKLSADIDAVIDTYKKSQEEELDLSDISPLQPPPPVIPTEQDTPTISDYEMLGGLSGMAGGTMSLAALASAYIAYKILDSRNAKTNPKSQAIRAMKDLQRRRKSLSEISPVVRVHQNSDGSLYPSI